MHLKLTFRIALVTGILALTATLHAGSALDALKASRVKGGLVVHVGCGDGKETAALRINDSILVQGLDSNAANVTKARKNINTKGLYGKVTVATFDGKTLPYRDNLVNVIVINDRSGKCQVSGEEITRVLAPRGVALVTNKRLIPSNINHQTSTIEGTGYLMFRKPVPSDIDDWTHYLHDANNNAVGKGRTVGPPRSMQWMATPVWSRHHDKLASISSVVTTRGRLFYIVDRGPAHTPNYTARWFVEARDAFNGILLWAQPIKSWVSHTKRFRSGPVQIARLLVADKDRVYTTLGLNEPVSILDGTTGDIIRTIKGTEKVEEILAHDSILFALIGEQEAEHVLTKGVDFRKKFLLAIDPTTGKHLWRWPKTGSADIIPRTPAASGKGLFFQEADSTVCLNTATGNQRWKRTLVETRQPKKPKPSKARPAKGKTKRKSRSKLGIRSPGWLFNTLVVSGDVVLSCDGNTVRALAAADGKKIWECPAKTPCGKTPSVDILVIDDIVWVSPSFIEGRSLKTGEVVKTLDLKQTLTTAGHHHRCYRNKATGDFILFAWRGTDFFDTKGDDHSRNNWVRGVCQYGVMPANGLLYAPPHNCGCYPEAVLHGFWALSHDGPATRLGSFFRGTLHKGEAFSKAPKGKSTVSPSDWPTYRLNSNRTGCSPSELPAKLKQAWQVEIGGSITAPVIANGLVLLACKDNHTVYAFDEKSGKLRWSLIADGMVDSPPTVYAGRVLFGTSAGSVYCIALDNGDLAWRFDAAPVQRNTVAMGNVESLWPVHGNILVKNGIAYFASGRSSYLDGGIFLFGLDAVTGQLKHSGRIKVEHVGRIKNKSATPSKGFQQNRTDYKTFDAPDKSDAFSMYGNLSDVMVADNDSVYLRHMRFNDDLTENPERKHHLFSTSNLLDDNEAHRSHWFYGNGDFSRLPVAYEWITRNIYGGYNTPFGRLLVFDENTVWGVYGHGETSQLFASDVRGFDEKMKKNFPSEKGRSGPAKMWTQSLPLHPRAMLKAGGSLYIAGAENTEQLVSDVPGGKLLVMSSSDGKQVSEFPLKSPPVFDGMATANNKLFISHKNGKLTCLQAK